MHLDPATLIRLDAAVPRYTSYPTVPAWGPLPEGTFAEAVAGLRAPASVYVHVPFCREQCWFCGCNMVVAGNAAAGDRYLGLLERQLAELPLGTRLALDRVHLGGGTPTWLSVPQLRRLFAALDQRFDRPGAEVSVEIDPDVTTPAHIAALCDLGLTRISIGVQSFDPRVLAAINRPQDPARIHALFADARARGLRGLNLDLVYGLPYQDVASLDATLDEVIGLAPDRVALYSFAYVPWAKPHQARLPAGSLPGPEEKAASYLHGYRRLTDAGYLPIGMDHFARPDDELAIGPLHRNFMGYTTRADLPILGLGPSAISELGPVYAQQESRLGAWYRAIGSGADGVVRGHVLSPDDVARRAVIHDLMCRLRLDAAALAAFPETAAGLDRFAAQGLGTYDAGGFALSGLGRFAVRQVAALFDAWLPAVDAARFSRAV